MIIGKKYLILAALVLALGAAVYLNWQFAPNEEFIDVGANTSNDEKAADSSDKTDYVVNLTGASSADANTQPDDAVTADKKPSEFDSAKSERDNVRKEALATLKSIIDDASMSDSQKTQAVNSYAKISENMDKEASIELLVKAKGFANCVVVISDSQVNVVVPTAESGLSAADVAVIRDIVMGQLDTAATNIKIIEVK